METERDFEFMFWVSLSLLPLFQLVVLALSVALTQAAAPGWSIWSNGMWNIPDDDNDNIPGVGGNDYPVNGQAQLCALNPTNPGCWSPNERH